MLQDAFIRSLSEILPEKEIAVFVESLDQEPVKSIRYNPFKSITPQEGLLAVPWCETGYYLPEKKIFTLDPLFHAGAYYVQESSSMFIEQMFKQEIFPQLGKEITVLDLCAAPGGKSTHISSLLGESGTLVANETIRSRCAILRENIIKWGIGNTIVTGNDPAEISRIKDYFDVVVIDAPCSGEGMFRKSEKAQQEWSEANVSLCSSRQQRILAQGWESLRPGGYCIYSTCTFNRRENEENVYRMIDELGAEIVTTPLETYEKAVRSQIREGYGYRFLPHRCQGEGFFAALLRKPGDSPKERKKERQKERFFVPVSKELKVTLEQWKGLDFFTLYNGSVFGGSQQLRETLLRVCETLYISHFGIEMGEAIHGKLKPAHALAMFFNQNPQIPTKELPLETALEYLRRNTIAADGFEEGYNIVTYCSLPLGWVKKTGNRTNNLYPKESRILHL